MQLATQLQGRPTAAAAAAASSHSRQMWHLEGHLRRTRKCASGCRASLHKACISNHPNSTTGSTAVFTAQNVARRRIAAVAAASGVVVATPEYASKVPAVKLDPEVKAKHKRPGGWHAPGPAPVGPSLDPSLTPQAHETLSYLTGDWRIFQLKDGHRWSMDDMMTAYVALQEAAALEQAAAAAAAGAGTSAGSSSSCTTHTLDIGCGIGSVLLMVAWGLRRQHMERQQQQQQQHNSHEQQQQQQQQQLADFCVRSAGLEAQTVSYQLAQRSIRYNLGPDCEVHGVQVCNQDLRQPLPYGPIHQLVTGTPPYIPEGSGGRSDRPQKAPCCLETRGGIEDYCAAAATALAPGGVFVVCGGIQGQPAKFKGRRAQLAAAAAGLVIVRQVTVVTREGKPPLFAVYVMRKADEVLQEKEQWLVKHQQQQQPGLQDQQAAQQILLQSSIEDQVASGQLLCCDELFVVQHADGSHSRGWHAARAAMGLPPLKQT